MRPILLSLVASTLLFGKEFIVSSSDELYLALRSAENNSEDDKIVLKQGRYVASSRMIFSYQSDENFDLTIEGETNAKRNDIVIDGNGLSTTLIISNTANKIITTISKVTIQNGYSKTNGGGLIIENQGELHLDNTAIINNKSQYDGAGLYSLGTTIINNSLISKNESLRGVGGGIYSAENLMIKLSNVSYNKAQKHGGGIFSIKTALLKDSNLSNNSSSYGGMIYGVGKIKITDSEIYNNSAKYDGGAIKSDIAKIINSNIYNNSAENYGGGLYSKDIDISSSSFSKNSAKYGGAIFGEKIQTKYSKFAENYAIYSGGAIKTTDALIKDSNFSNNKSEKNGGAIETVMSSIVSSNFIKNKSEKGGAVSTKSLSLTNANMRQNYASASGGAVKGYDLKIRYSTFCENRSANVGGAIDGVSITLTNSNLSKNQSVRGGAVHGIHTSKIDIVSSIFFQNSAYLGGAIFGNVKLFNSLMLNNKGKGMALYGKGALINNIVKNETASDKVSEELFMTGNLILENNYLNLSNIYNYQFYKLEKAGNLPVSNFTNKADLIKVFGNESPLVNINLNIDPSIKNCSDILNTEKLYISIIGNPLIHKNKDLDENLNTINNRNKNQQIRNSLYADISDLMIEGDQKIYKEIYFIVVTTEGKNPVKNYFIDFDEGKGYEELQNNLISHRFHESGIKDIKVKIVDQEGKIAEKTFPLDIYELSQDEFRELLKDKESRRYLESISSGVVKIAENQKDSKYSYALGIIASENQKDSNASNNDIKNINDKYGKLIEELQVEETNTNEFNISKMIQFNNGINEVKDYILSNIEESNNMSKGDSKDAIDNAKKYILDNPKEFNLTTFKNYEEIIVEIQEHILTHLDEYNLTSKKNVDNAYKQGREKVISNPKDFNLMSMSDLQNEMQKLTQKIQEDPSKYGIRVTRQILNSLDKGWSLLGTLAEINDISVFDGFKIVWIFADGVFKGYSSNPEIRKKIVNANFEVFTKVPRNAGIWLYK